MELPELYKNNIDYKSDDFISFRSNNSPNKDLNWSLLDNLPKKIYVETKTKKYNEWIIGKTNKHLVTIRKEVINIKDIIILKEAIY